MAENEDEYEGFWIRTEPTLDGKAFVVTLSVDANTSLTLTPVRATQYASALLAAVADAEYDAAILKQLTVKLGLEVATAGQLIIDLRAERPERLAAGLRFVPGVSQRQHHPFVMIEKDDRPLGQLDTPAARRHAMHVLEAPPAADLDAAYLKVLRSLVGLDENRAREVVADIDNHRQEWAVSDD